MSRHLGIVFRGTGGIIGQDYVSRVMQACSDLVEEINPDFPASMGGIPVGDAVDLRAPSMDRAVEIAVADAQRIIRHELEVNPNRRVIVGGYSAGAVAAAKVRQWLAEEIPDNYLCSFSFGDPTRPYGGSYYDGPWLSGQGIASWHYGDIYDYRHCWLTDPGDMYGNVPLRTVGAIMGSCYDIVTQTQLSDPLGTARAIVPMIPKVAEEAGIDLPGLIRYATDGVIGSGILGVGVPLVLGMLQGFVGKGDPNRLTGPAAAAHAIKVALEFATTKPATAPHIEYEYREVWPGQTYLGLAIQHVRDWGSRIPPI